MTSVVATVLIAVAAAAIGFLAAWLIVRRFGEKSLAKAEEEAKRIISEAVKEAEIKKKEVALESREKLMREKADQEKQLDGQRRELEKLEKTLHERESTQQKRAQELDQMDKDLSGRAKGLQTRQKGIELREEELKAIIDQQNDRLQKIAQMTPEEAKKQLMDNMIGEAKMEAAAHIKEIKEQAEQTADREAKEIILQSIYRCAADHTVETTVSVVTLPTDEMKGRIIGREGRNIRAFETVTGIDVIVDDTPEAVILSGYDPVRREVARMTLEKLVSDGRIHPTRIEEVFEKSQKEMEVMVREAGEQACFELGIHGLHPDLLNMLGKLNYRTSYGQNVLAHSKEVAMICGLLAAQLELDDVMARRCGLLHDVGKAIDRITEGTHTEIGADFLRRYKEHEIVVNAAEAHHGDVPMLSPYPVLVQTADAISGSRPGARREPLEAYIKRLQQLEEVADSFKGVSKAYAIQAGREIRVIVEHDKIDDLAASVLAGDIAEKIESDMQYPGQIKVTVIREMRATEFAK
ncbi:ribonuclease Y [candidate division GN15 bacterium]|nr:ribonuclease Y [candidate division GN15 bacterium]